MQTACAEFQASHPDLSFALLGPRENLGRLDLAPYGVVARALAAEDHPGLVQAYLELNRRCFPALPLPGWVLVDVYLMPGAIGLWLASDGSIAAAWVGIPSMVVGRPVGVSLLSVRPGIAAWCKVLTARALRSSAVRGVTQWGSKSLRTHTRLGPLRVVGPAPTGHELGASTFVYETDLSDEAVVAAALGRNLAVTVQERVAVGDAARLGELAAEAAAGRHLWVVPPGLETGEVCFGVVTKTSTSTR